MYPKPTPWPHRHGEAFCRMLYRCEGPERHEEWVWNSRDGVTPLIIGCPVAGCRTGAEHVEWARDQYQPDYRPVVGERVFRDGTPEEALVIMWRRWLGMRDEYPLEPAQALALLEESWRTAQGEGPDEPGREFAPGWAHLEIVR